MAWACSFCSGDSMGDWRRHAIYFAAPAGSALARFGAEWLGWDPEAGERRGDFSLPGLPLPRAELVEAPRRYGFHATLKPPFRLAEGRGEEGLDAAYRAGDYDVPWNDPGAHGTPPQRMAAFFLGYRGSESACGEVRSGELGSIIGIPPEDRPTGSLAEQIPPDENCGGGFTMRHARIAAEQADAFAQRLFELALEFTRLPRDGDVVYGLIAGVYPTAHAILPPRQDP